MTERLVGASNQLARRVMTASADAHSSREITSSSTCRPLTADREHDKERMERL